MGKLFDIDGKVYRLLEKITNIITVSFLWMLFSLPLFTIGASTTALYHTYHQVVQNSNGKLFGTFQAAFRSNFKQSTALWFIQTLALVFLLLDCYFCYILSDVYTELKFLLVFFAIAVLFVTMWSQYWFSYIAHICDPVKTVLKNTLIMSVKHFPQSLAILATVITCATVICVLPNGIILLPFAPTICLLFIYRQLIRVYSEYWDTEVTIPD